MKTKKIIILLSLLLGQFSHAAELASLDIDEEGFEDFNENGDYSLEIAQLINQTRAPSCVFTTQDLVGIADSTLNFPTLLQFNAYKHTNPPVIRSLHDLPSLRPWYGCDDALCFYATFFYNPMFHAYFTRCGSFLSDYLFISQEDALIAELENLIPEIPQVLPLFNIARLQQRRLGVMLGASKCFGNVRFNMAIPLFYQELNFYLTQAQVDALNASPFFGGIQPQPVSEGAQNLGFAIFDPNTFIDRHLISDKIGLGDIRFYLDYMFFDDTRCPWRVGGMLTLPNSTVFRHSIVGSNFDKCYPGPGLSLEEILVLQCIAETGGPTDPLTLDAKNKLAVLAQSYAIQFLDRLSATVLQNSLGQQQVSYGFLTEAFVELTDCTHLCLYFEWDQFLQGQEERPVRLVISPGQSLERDYEDPTLAQDNLTFLQQRFINILFPPIANLKVHRGDIIKARFYTQTDWRILQWNIGYDLWWQGRERLYACTSCALPNAQLDLKSAERPTALQGKIFGGCDVQRHPEYYDTFGWRLGLKGEATVNNYGIGKDWVIGVDFVADF